LIRPPLPNKTTSNTVTTNPGDDQNNENNNDATETSKTTTEMPQQQQRQSSSSSPKMNNLRSTLESVTVYVAGFCKIDSRWHNVTEYNKMYGKVHPYVQMLQDTFDDDLLSQPDDTVCFWATNGMDGLELAERSEGRYGNSELKKGHVLAFTFRVDIPPDLPHSVHATTCRYYYTANLLVKTKTQQQIVKRSFQVTTNPFQILTSTNAFSTEKKDTVITSRVKFGNCVGMAHSKGLPCHLSATEIHRPKGQMTVVQRDYNRSTQHDIQTIRVSNTHGRPVCVMTLIGTQTMTPGSRLHIQWDFPKRRRQQGRRRQQQQSTTTTTSTSSDDDDNDNDNDTTWIPCHQVSACLQGEERAVYEDGTTKRTQSFIFDTCHEWVDPLTTNRACKTMVLSSDNNPDGCPCNIKTDVMELEVWCQVDIAVEESNSYNNLSLKVPCRIMHYLVDEDEQVVSEESRVVPLNELLGMGSAGNHNDFVTNDITSDLKILSLTMEERLRARSS
jgi:hypothetical protein